MQYALSTAGWQPVPIALGQARYGPYGPPFADARLQATFDAEARSLASESAFITEGTARKLLATVINSALAAGDSKIPEIEARVRAAAAIAARSAAEPAAATAARVPVAALLLGAFTLVLGAGVAVVTVRAVRR